MISVLLPSLSSSILRRNDNSLKRDIIASGKYDNRMTRQKNDRSTLVVKNDFSNIFYGKWDYDAEDDQELTFLQGDELYIIGREYEDQGWLVAKLSGKVGFVPKEFVCPAYEEIKVT